MALEVFQMQGKGQKRVGIVLNLRQSLYMYEGKNAKIKKAGF